MATIALVGNPNSGKTTLFNALTGASQRVGNWPGVTVEKKTGRVKQHPDLEIIDLPGIYSLSPYSPEERISRNYLLNESPDLIIDIVDATNLERNLYLSTQLAELGIPMVIALNFSDLLEKENQQVDLDKLSGFLGVPVISISALRKTGLDALIETAATYRDQPQPLRFSDELEDWIERVEGKLPTDTASSRFVAVKWLENDELVRSEYLISEALIGEVWRHEKKVDQEFAALVSDARYRAITDQKLKKIIPQSQKLTRSDRIDQILTNRWLALPIFALIIFLVYYISVTTVGEWLTGLFEDGIFGEEGLEILGNHIPGIPVAAGDFLSNIGASEIVTSLVVDGIIGGVGSVLTFVPQMLVLFFLLAILEYSGYMARVAFIMDRLFRRFGLSGKSFIPMLIGTGCSIPGIMATRTIENERDRRMTIITTPFMPCGAKLPIIALIAGAIFGGSGLVAAGAYFGGIFAALLSGIILKKTRWFAGEPSPFIMELPEYRLPGIANVLHSTWERGWSFIKKAGTIILVSSVFIWLLSSFGYIDGAFAWTDELENSFLAFIGHKIAVLFRPLGFDNWKAAVATFTGLVAKENVVSTFGVLYGLEEVAEDGLEIWAQLRAEFIPLAGLSFLAFNLYCVPCFAAIGATKREMGSGRWTWFAIIYQTLFAYALSLILYQLGSWFMGGSFGVLTAIAIILSLGLILWLAWPRRDLPEPLAQNI